MDEATVRANGIEFAYLSKGSGPLVLLLHGFPDNAWTYTAQIEALAASGFTAVAPFMRGYHPTEAPAGGYYDNATLIEDARALIEELGDGAAYVVGHDWGAQATYGLCAAYPDHVRRAVTLALPHPSVFPRMMGDVEQAQRSFYMWFFQIPVLPEATFALNDFALVEKLWRDWSPGFDAASHLAGVKETFGHASTVEAAIAYYRALFDPSRWDPALNETRTRTASQITTPVMAMFGLDDGCLDPKYGEWADELFHAEYERVSLPGCGHFLHLERPDEVNGAMVRWFGAA